jgi:hypothetical protein
MRRQDFARRFLAFGERLIFRRLHAGGDGPSEARRV